MVDRLRDQARQVVEPVAQASAFPIDEAETGFRTEAVARLQIAVREAQPRAGFGDCLLGKSDRCRQASSPLSRPVKRRDQRLER